MKTFLLALSLSILAPAPSYASAELAASDATVVELEADGEFASVDKAVYCSVAMVNRRNRIVRRYNGNRSWRTFRCERPLRQCRQDLRLRRIPARCVELR